MRTILILLLLTQTAFAGSITLNYPDGEQARILNGITEDGAKCNQGEALGVCAKRIITTYIKDQVKYWDSVKAKKAALDALNPPSDPSVS